MTKEIEEFIRYLVSQGYQSKNTLQSYKRDLTHLQNYLKDCKIDNFSQVTEELLQNYVKDLSKKGTATSSISRCTATIHRFFEYLVSKNNLLENPSLNLKAPHVETKEPAILTEEEIKLLLNAPKGNNPKSIRDRTILRLLYETGLRVSEFVLLKVDSVDLENCKVLCPDRVRSLTISQETTNLLSHYLKDVRTVFEKGRGASELFLNYTGGGLSRQGVWKLLKTYGELAHIEKEITPHTLRHTFAVHSLRNGMNVHVLSKILGHSDSSTTRIYKKLV
jgi:integrase/recombinase XerD